MKTTETVQKKIEAWYNHFKDNQDSQGNDGNF